MIKFRNVTKKYNNNIILKNINIDIEHGEKIVIFGQSGSGKSTFLRCINRLDNIDSGSITIDNVEFDKNNITKSIGMVFQHFNLFPHMNVCDNLIYAPITVLKENKDQAIERAKSILDMFGIGQKINDNISSLSGGQKQRVAIARTLMMKPNIILFDEPTSALDPFMAREVIKSIKIVARDDVTILLVSHNISFAKEIANRILFFCNGKIIEDNNTYDFFNSPKTKEVINFLENSII